ncbi:hemolysin family protein [Brachybacterium sp. YJGR34]|uniref:hemolysin family protein n=1 Tax=Brachybacterium sp. YJGR34 TaxID=2059911 RepID=UPI000E0A6E4F|nr:hemolysin family protein [Brachybacterium sp. YJGR34]
MSDPLVVIVITVALIALSALFVIIEFSLLGARSHRLEAEAGSSRSARAALRSINELTVMLAGAQLGITVCTFALGAVTKPAVDAWLAPVLTGWGIPSALAGTAAFVMSLLIVTFLHLVVGEMAPKSWAIAHPELSAKATALPTRAYIWLLRPVLRGVNQIANRLVSASGVTPVERAAVGGQDAETIRQLVEHSTSTGTLDGRFHQQLSGVLSLQDRTLERLIAPDARPTSVPSGATVAELQAAAHRSGHLRVLIERTDGRAPGVVHVRDTLLEPVERPVEDLARDALTLPAGTTLHDALTRIRRSGEQLVAVLDEGRFLGVVTLSDILAEVMSTREESRA